MQLWKPLKAMPDNCKVKEYEEMPEDCYKVRCERKGYLYIDLGERTIKVLNPFAEVPHYVHAIQTNEGWQLWR